MSEMEDFDSLRREEDPDSCGDGIKQLLDDLTGMLKTAATAANVYSSPAGGVVGSTWYPEPET